jgi:hypothetical protein
VDFLLDNGDIGRRSRDRITKRPRRNHTTAKVALAAIKGEKKLAEYEEVYLKAYDAVAERAPR